MKGTISPAIGNLTMLVDLYMEANTLTGTIPTELGNLRNLNLLYRPSLSPPPPPPPPFHSPLT